ncbi:hypothetical protein [Burkholderia cenocepacia]|uniref:hypothetical protein n=1 Tax=Burkholderia cenocepacia TaxID=95486 RepID=UPI000F5B2A9B|nr:hypothetical protein [Burkholderia cenocepacia]
MQLASVNAGRIGRGKAPYIPVFNEADRQGDAFERRLQKFRVLGDSSRENYNEKFSIFEESKLRRIQEGAQISFGKVNRADKVYVCAHGMPGEGALGTKKGEKKSVDSIAETLVEELKLPADVEVRVVACWGGASREVQVTSDDIEATCDDHGFFHRKIGLESNRGRFSTSFAGQLERALIKRQPKRPEGLVSGYIGSVTLLEKSDEVWRKKPGGGFEWFEGHAKAHFDVLGPDGLETGEEMLLRRSDTRCTVHGMARK